MSYFKLTILFLGLLFIISGCESIDDSIDDNNGDSTSSSSIQAKDVDALGQNVATIIPGCAYNSDNVSQSASVKSKVLATLFNDTIIKNNAKRSKISRESTINETVSGTCGGSMTSTGSHADGNNDLVVTFNNYCTGSDGSTSTINGSMSQYDDGTPGTYGPTIEKTIVSTGGSGLQIQTTEDGETTNSTIVLDNVVFQYGNPSGTSTQSNQSTMTFTRILINDGTDIYDTRNGNITTYTDSNSNPVVQIVTVEYIDPDLGLVTVSTTPITRTDSKTTGSLSVTGGGDTVIFESSNDSNSLYTVKLDGEEVGAVDCSAVR